MKRFKPCVISCSMRLRPRLAYNDLAEAAWQNELAYSNSRAARQNEAEIDIGAATCKRRWKGSECSMRMLRAEQFGLTREVEYGTPEQNETVTTDR